jgi:hypothetical protein
VPATPSTKVDAAPALHHREGSGYDDEQGEQSDQEQDNRQDHGVWSLISAISSPAAL